MTFFLEILYYFIQDVYTVRLMYTDRQARGQIGSAELRGELNTIIILIVLAVKF